jgi:hypothetical protein
MTPVFLCYEILRDEAGEVRGHRLIFADSREVFHVDAIGDGGQTACIEIEKSLPIPRRWWKGASIWEAENGD